MRYSMHNKFITEHVANVAVLSIEEIKHCVVNSIGRKNIVISKYIKEGGIINREMYLNMLNIQNDWILYLIQNNLYVPTLEEATHDIYNNFSDLSVRVYNCLKYELKNDIFLLILKNTPNLLKIFLNNDYDFTEYQLKECIINGLVEFIDMYIHKGFVITDDMYLNAILSKNIRLCDKYFEYIENPSYENICAHLRLKIQV